MPVALTDERYRFNFGAWSLTTLILCIFSLVVIWISGATDIWLYRQGAIDLYAVLTMGFVLHTPKLNHETLLLAYCVSFVITTLLNMRGSDLALTSAYSCALCALLGYLLIVREDLDTLTLVLAVIGVWSLGAFSILACIVLALVLLSGGFYADLKKVIGFYSRFLRLLFMMFVLPVLIFACRNLYNSNSVLAITLPLILLMNVWYIKFPSKAMLGLALRGK